MQSFSEEKETVRETEHNTNTLHHLFIGCVGDRAFKDNDDDEEFQRHERPSAASRMQE